MALQFHNKVTHTMYSPTWIINIRIVCAAKLKSIFPFINFIKDFRFIIFVFFFQAKFSTHRQKDRFYTKQKIISHFFFLRALTFYFLINLFIAIQLFYIKRYHIFIRFSPSFLFHIIIQQNDLSIHKSIESFPSTSQILFAKYILTQCIVTNAIRNNSFAAVHRS